MSLWPGFERKKRGSQKESLFVIMKLMKPAKKNILTPDLIKHIALLANLKISQDKLAKLLPQLTSVLDYMSKIQNLNTDNTSSTSQVTGLENVFREDEIEKDRILSQKDVLVNAKKTYQGYFVVKAIFAE